MTSRANVTGWRPWLRKNAAVPLALAIFGHDFLLHAGYIAAPAPPDPPALAAPVASRALDAARAIDALDAQRHRSASLRPVSGPRTTPRGRGQTPRRMSVASP
jgi:hypothetical protein